ncbi:MAG: hypothetical protein LQ352_001193 [Teloschistes flavicans]|nr:MAG: hypothetical protein LQ352_001193 [Teloschistes flavicans]
MTPGIRGRNPCTRLFASLGSKVKAAAAPKGLEDDLYVPPHHLGDATSNPWTILVLLTPTFVSVWDRWERNLLLNGDKSLLSFEPVLIELMENSDMPQHNPYWDQFMPYDFNNPSSENVDHSWDLFSPTHIEPLTSNRGRSSPHTLEPNSNNSGSGSSSSNDSNCPALRCQRRNAFSQFNLAANLNNSNHSQNYHSHSSPRNTTATERTFPSSHSQSPLGLQQRIPSINHQTFDWPAFPAFPLASGVDYQPAPLSGIESNNGQYSPNVDGHTGWDNTDYDSLFGETNNIPDEFWTDLTNPANDSPTVNNPFSDSNHRTGSENGTHNLDFDRNDSNSNYHDRFVDLTNSSPTHTAAMPPITRKRSAAQIIESSPAAHTATAASSSSSSSSSSRPITTNNNNTAAPTFRAAAVEVNGKRRRLSSTPIPLARPRSTTVREVGNNRPKEIPHLDLTTIDDDDAYLSTMLRDQQQASAVRAQQLQLQQRDLGHGDAAQRAKEQEATKLSNVTCIICMESMTDMTVTHCGHLFCHTCIMEALIAGENQSNPGDPGKGTSKCPVCRKKVVRPGGKGRDRRDVIPLEIKCVTRSQLVKGKAKAKI